VQPEPSAASAEPDIEHRDVLERNEDEPQGQHREDTEPEDEPQDREDTEPRAVQPEPSAAGAEPDIEVSDEIEREEDA